MSRPNFIKRNEVPQRRIPSKVTNKDIFVGSNVFARWYYIDGTPDNAMYVLFSYGEHFPMYVYDQNDKQWYGNCDKASKTTSRHMSVCHPFSREEDKPICFDYNTTFLRALYEHGSIMADVPRLCVRCASMTDIPQ